MDIMGYYYRGSYDEAACSDTTCVFPNRLEAIQALRGANPDDYKAPFLLGNLFYDKRQYDLAVSEWEKSVSLNPEFPTAWRNLALAYYNKQHDPEKARTAIEKAFELDKTDSRILMELDQLYKKLGVSFADRLSLLQSYPALVGERDDLLLEEITLLNLTGRYVEAMAKLDGHIFHPWEGGEGKVTAQYQFSRIELAKIALREERYADALRLLEECLVYPHNLGEGRLVCAQE